jgi:hypothetical protein
MVCLDVQDHYSGVVFEIEFEDAADQVRVTWQAEVTERIRTAHNVLDERVDKGACAVALLLLPEFAGLYGVRASLKWSGFDYYLSPNREPGKYFLNDTAVLEVSGIQAENRGNSVNRRVNRKIGRVDDYKTKPDYKTSDLPHYYCVVEFSKPRSKVVLT